LNASSDSSTLINLCRKHNEQIISILQQLPKNDVAEVMRTAERSHAILGRCASDYGEITARLKSLEPVYVTICKMEKKIQQLQENRSLIRFITQPRLRSQVELARICIL
jgi:hypothetical protein